MKNIITVFKKEFYRVITDKRLIFTAIILPGLAIYIMYSFMGGALTGQTEDINTHEMNIYYKNVPQVLLLMLEEDTLQTDELYKRNVLLTEVTNESFEDIETLIYNGEIDYYIEFPSDFDNTILNYQDDQYIIPNINTYYNPGENYSISTNAYVYSYLSYYSNLIALDRFGDELTPFTIDLANENHRIFDELKAMGKEYAMLLPMLIIMFLFSGAMSIGPDSIAGEKERGTIATLLVTPIKRSQLAIGKVISLSTISLMSAASSFIGVLLGLKNLMGQESLENIYSMREYFQIFIVLLSTVIVIVGLVSMVSAYAKTIKEASMLILPFYFISIIIAVSTMFSGEASSSITSYFIPIYSSVNMLISILTFDVNTTNFIVMVLSSIVYVGILIFIINKLFQSEKVMFSK